MCPSDQCTIKLLQLSLFNISPENHRCCGLSLTSWSDKDFVPHILRFLKICCHLASGPLPRTSINISILSEQVHIAGVGDYSLVGITGLADPCPLPSAAKKKGLRDKEKLFYAPMSGLGDLLYDKDAVYININDHLVQFSKADDDNSGVTRKGKDRDVGEVLVKSLQNTKYSIDEKLEKSFITFFSKKPDILSEASTDVKYAHEPFDQTKGVEPVDEHQLEQAFKTDGSGEESDSEDLDSLGSPDDDQTFGKDLDIRAVVNDPDENNCDASEQQHSSKINLTEHVDFCEGRMRRKAVFGNDIDLDDLKQNQFLMSKAAIKKQEEINGTKKGGVYHVHSRSNAKAKESDLEVAGVILLELRIPIGFIHNNLMCAFGWTAHWLGRLV
ncbi:unnamed protein product [Ilex paraguariensis]|uniref:Uncharacterized protein n=1 Tax=Ilex paraguariensis TaxID=185542 RepID=A0ABC8SGC3_9AQUA